MVKRSWYVESLVEPKAFNKQQLHGYGGSWSNCGCSCSNCALCLQEWTGERDFEPDAQGVVAAHGFKEEVRTAGHYRITISPLDTYGWMPDAVGIRRCAMHRHFFSCGT
jgi:hypothetical protein